MTDDTAGKLAAAAELDLRRELTLALAHLSPIIYCDGASTSGHFAGVGNITLTCAQHVTVAGKSTGETRTVAHLRFPMNMVPVLREALDNIELLAKPAASTEKQ